MAVILTPPGRSLLLQQIKPILNISTIRLYQNDIELDEFMTTDDFVEANFGGYQRELATWDDPEILPNGTASIQTPILEFVRGGGTPSNDIYGYYIVNGLTFELLTAQSFNGTPLAMVNNGDTIQFKAKIMVGSCDTSVTRHFIFFPKGKIILNIPNFSYEGSGFLSLGSPFEPLTITGISTNQASYVYDAWGRLYFRTEFYHEASGNLRLNSSQNDPIRLSGEVEVYVTYVY